jgi:hypothetical protein
LITPLVGIGPVKFGMTFEEAKKLLGEPDLILGDGIYQYRFGFALIAGRGENKVAAILAGGSCRGDEPMVEAFKGATKEGIGMNATKEQIVTAFGPPTNNDDASQAGDPEVELLRYDSLGMELILRGGRLVHFALKPAPATSTDNVSAAK